MNLELVYLDSLNVPEEHRASVAADQIAENEWSDLYHGAVRACLDALTGQDLVQELERLEPRDRLYFFRGLSACRPECNPISWCAIATSGSYEDCALEIASLPSSEAEQWASSYLGARLEVELRRQQLATRLPAITAATVKAIGAEGEAQGEAEAGDGDGRGPVCGEGLEEALRLALREIETRHAQDRIERAFLSSLGELSPAEALRIALDLLRWRHG